MNTSSLIKASNEVPAWVSSAVKTEAIQSLACSRIDLVKTLTPGDFRHLKSQGTMSV